MSTNNNTNNGRSSISIQKNNQTNSYSNSNQGASYNNNQMNSYSNNQISDYNNRNLQTNSRNKSTRNNIK
jgi:hypothetical protein